ncbi:MAG: histidine phosphatase family protein [Nitrospirales bacterium]|nr:histidine phosphatase family protein [Nitrospirales bacterium]
MTMKTLYVFRHAEAASTDRNGTDYDRPLHERGKSEAFVMGQRLLSWPKPDIIISSPALRATTTATLLATAISYPLPRIVFDKQVYEAEMEDLFLVIREIDDSLSCAMLVGHNPALTQFVNILGRCDVGNMPTCSMAILRLPMDTWNDIDRIRGELKVFDYPAKPEKSMRATR